MKRRKTIIAVALCVIVCAAGALALAESAGGRTALGILSSQVSAGGLVDGALEAVRGALGKASVDELLEMRALLDGELERRGIDPNDTEADAVEDHDFPDISACAGRLDQIDSIVAFGDSIFAGYGIPDAHGIVQQLAETLNVPLTCYAEPNATLSTRQTNPKNVVQQVYEYVPATGTKPLIVIDGGTNDQYQYNLANLGTYGTNDTSTIYGATLTIIQNLIAKGIEPWQIVITTPIPKGIQGDAAYRARIDAQLSRTGLAMYEVGLAMRCSVINGYHSIFGIADSYELKIVMLPDDMHPSETGAAYYADYIRRILS